LIQEAAMLRGGLNLRSVRLRQVHNKAIVSDSKANEFRTADLPALTGGPTSVTDPTF